MRKFILGTDWWTDCDDAVALRLLARAHKAGEIALLGIGINGCMEYSVTSLEGFLNTERVYDIPIGIDLEGTDFGGEPRYQKRLATHAEKYTNNGDAEDAVRLYRRLLAATDAPVEILEIGYPQVLSAVLLSEPDDLSPLTGIELVKQTVKKIWVMAGQWDIDGGVENNFARNARSRQAAHVLCERCPVPMTFLGFEVGVSVISGGCCGKDDPLGLVLIDHGSPNGRCSWDPMLCLLALVGDEAQAGYTLVRGRATVDPATGENRFIENENGPHAYVVKTREDAYYAKEIDRRIQ